LACSSTHPLPFLSLTFPLYWGIGPSQDQGSLLSYAAGDTSVFFDSWFSPRELWGYWLVHIIVRPMGLQTPSAPWVLSLGPPLETLCFI
jgi:hypothetical protein